MEQWKGTKCEPGYIHKQKIFQTLMLFVFIAIGIGLFLLGILITGTRANIFTVLAILMVLPGAKRVISLVVMLPRQSVAGERYDRMKTLLSPDAVLLTDYVFTSQDRIMSLDFVVVQDRHVIGVCPGGRADDRVTYMTDYLKKGIAGIADGYGVKILDSDEEFQKFYARLSGGNGAPDESVDEQPEKTAEVVEYLKILAV